ncbi:CHAT domain-containing protein [Kitasatospora sp. NPDC059673]|uniref:CHAT domain-containing protein n=1 Tax=Kitasatospora sp. NPDC059673 TaxID=3346901 RepID=UPI0036CBF461
MTRDDGTWSVQARIQEAQRLIAEYQRGLGDGRLLDSAEQLLHSVRGPVPAMARATVTHTLGIVAVLRWESTGLRERLAEAVTLFRVALNEATGPGSEPAPVFLVSLAQALLQHGGGPAELDECVTVHRRLLAVGSEADPRYVDHLHGATEALRARYRSTRQRADLVECLELYRREAELLPAGDRLRAEVLRARAGALDELCQRDSGRPVADEAVAAWRALLAVPPTGHRERPADRFRLGAALLRRYKRAPAREDLEEAVLVLDAAYREAPHPGGGTVSMAMALCEALTARAAVRESGGSAAHDLDLALAVLRHATGVLGPENPDSVALGVMTTMTLRRKYEATGGIEVLDLAVREGRRVHAAARSVDRGNLAVACGTLAEALLARHRLTTRPDDLDEAIALLQAATASASPANRTGLAQTLANCLLARAAGTRHTGDVQDAIAVLRAARDALGPGDRSGRHAGLSMSLGNAQLRLFERTGDPAFLVRATEEYGVGLDSLDPRGPQYRGALADMAHALRTAHELTRAPELLDLAVGHFRRALALCPAEHEERWLHLDNLGYALRKRYDATGDLADLRECTTLLREAVATFPAQHPGQMAGRHSLAQALRAEHLHTGDLALVREAAEVAAAASRVLTARVSDRIVALDNLGHCRATLGDWPGAADALGDAVALLPRLASRDRLTMDQHHDLGGLSGVAGHAAACALNAGRPERALELLEQGRGILLGRRLAAGDGLAPLWAADPDLARAFADLRRAFDPPVPGPGSGLRAAAPWASGRGGGREAEWARLLDRIRALPGLGDFLRPATTGELLAAAAGTAVVLIVPARYRSDALILRDGRLEVLPLPELTPDEAADRAEALHAAVAEAHDLTVRAGHRLAAQQTVREVLDWLWTTTVRPVLDHLGHRTPPPPGAAWPRVTWCPTGPMAFLPLHAAGTDPGRSRADRGRARRGPDESESALDRVVSSCTPTVEALIRLRSRPPTHPARRKSCVVAMSTTPGGFSPLPSAIPEARIAAASLPNARTAADGGANRARVLAELSDATHAHFSCHAVADPANPGAGRLLLHDHADRPLTVGDISAIGLDRAESAYLSACSTTRPAPRLGDEAVHITGAFLLAGFRHVIGTLWQTDDAAALEIARQYYAAPGAPPFALHTAVRALRDRYPRTPTLWAAHIHTGA